MTQRIHLHNMADLHKLFRLGPSMHPLVAILDFSEVGKHMDSRVKITTDFYSVMCKRTCRNTIKYGRKHLDFQDGNLICMAPNQLIEVDEGYDETESMSGWGLFFHPDLFRATSLREKMKDYGFFHYDVSESLHLSEKERTILYECVGMIQCELQENIDVHSEQIIVSTIELLLNYCTRFYGRQMITRSQANRTILARIEQILADHFAISKSREVGLPTVRFLADCVHLSPNYLSDLLKKETGKNAQELIHFHLIEEAKHHLIHSDKQIHEIAHDLGFEYPQYFAKLFKQKTGKTPMEFRSLN